RQPDGAGVECGAHVSAHAVELDRGRGTVVHRQDGPADGRVSDELRDVDADAGAAVAVRLRRQVEGAATVRVDEDGRDALRKERPGRVQSCSREALPGVRVDVDEARRDDLPLHVYFAGGAPAVEIADGDDAAAAERDAARRQGAVGAV